MTVKNISYKKMYHAAKPKKIVDKLYPSLISKTI